MSQLEQALAMRREGRSSAEIASELGVADSTVRGWWSDPRGARARARRAGYAGRCPRCGACTSANRRHGPVRLCRRCSAAPRRRWSRQLVRARVQAWHGRYGEWPTSSDWHSTRARERGGEAWRRWQEGTWPPASTVTRLFGRFALALPANVRTTSKPRRRS